MKRDLARGDRQRTDRYAGQRHIDEFADPFDGCDLHVVWEVPAQMFRRHLCSDGKHQSRFGEQCAIVDDADAHAGGPFLERDLNRSLVKHCTQRLVELRDDRGEGPRAGAGLGGAQG